MNHDSVTPLLSPFKILVLDKAIIYYDSFILVYIEWCYQNILESPSFVTSMPSWIIQIFFKLELWSPFFTIVKEFLA